MGFRRVSKKETLIIPVARVEVSMNDEKDKDKKEKKDKHDDHPPQGRPPEKDRKVG